VAWKWSSGINIYYINISLNMSIHLPTKSARGKCCAEDKIGLWGTDQCMENGGKTLENR